MGEESLFSKWLRRYGIGVGLGVVGLGLVSFGSWQYLRPRPVEVEVLRQAKNKSFKEASESGIRGVEEVVVNVSGAVRKPGVYQFKEGARVAEALIGAGGLAKEADRAWVDKNLNLARKLRDGEKIYVPRIGEDLGSDFGFRDSAVKGSFTSVVNVNTASLSELDSLWGIGESRARAIIEHRPYRSLEELVTKAGIPQSVLDKNEGKIGL